MSQKESAALFQVLTRFPPDDVRHAIPAIVFELMQTHPDVQVPAPVVNYAIPPA